MMRWLPIFLWTLLLGGCTTSVPIQMRDSAPIIIYKTRGDYTHLVPVTLSDDKQRIVAYPAPSDLWMNDQLQQPILLRDGYLLDRRGINRQVAFLSLSYQEYIDLENLPPLSEMHKLIVDDDPLTEMYHCGTRSQYANLEKALNRAIKKGEVNRFQGLL